MSFDPVQRFLGLPPDASPLELLNLRPGERVSVAVVDEALRRRLVDVYNHPDRGSDDAESVRRTLRNAAAALKAQLSGVSAHQHPHANRRPALTRFDRDVLAVLVGSGGWNAMSRRRLISLAASHDVSSFGLMKVIRGLGQYAAPASRGGARFAMPEIVAGCYPRQAHAQSRQPQGELSIAAVSTRAPIEDEQAASAGRTLQLSFVFGLIALAIAVLAVAVFAPRSERGSSSDGLAAAPQLGEAERGDPYVLTPAEPSVSRTEAVQRREVPHVAQFDAWPTFHADVPEETADALAVVEEAVADLDGVVARLSIAQSAEGPSESVYRTWNDIIQNVSRCWVLLSERELQRIERRVGDVVLAAGDATGERSPVHDRLLDALDPEAESLDPITNPLTVWSGAWRAGMLARIASHPRMPPEVVESARARLSMMLVDERTEQSGGGFRHVAARWLTSARARLIEGLGEPDKVEYAWELWISAQWRIGPPERVRSVLLSTIVAIIESMSPLWPDAAGGAVDLIDIEAVPHLRFVGRLLAEGGLDVNETVRGHFLELFTNEHVHPADLWVITSLMSRLPEANWFIDDLVLAPDAAVAQRRDARRAIAAAWARNARLVRPLRAAPTIDVRMAERWLRLAEQVERESINVSSEKALLQHLLRAARIGESGACLVAGRQEAADRLLDLIEASFGDEPDGDTRPAGVGTPQGTGGGWSAVYRDARRDVEERLRLLRALRANAGGDLHPQDAVVFVREVYHGAPAEVREMAQDLLVDVFARGPNVARQMLDQFPDAPRSQSVRTVLERYTTTPLGSGSASSDEWMVDARLGLVEHLMSLLSSSTAAIDQLAGELGASYAAQIVTPGERPGTASIDAAALRPTEGAARAFDHWRQSAHAYGASRFGEELIALDRRHKARLRLAHGPVQETIVQRIGAVEFMAIALRAEHAELDREVSHVMEQASATRRAAPNALLQLMHVERSAIALWKHRLNIHALIDELWEDAI